MVSLLPNLFIEPHVVNEGTTCIRRCVSVDMTSCEEVRSVVLLTAIFAGFILLAFFFVNITSAWARTQVGVALRAVERLLPRRRTGETNTTLQDGA